MIRERVAIIGSRDGVPAALVRDYVTCLPRSTIVVSGGARGVDTVAETTAKSLRRSRIILEPCPTDESSASYIRALFARNVEIAMRCDRMVAFRAKGKSNGTDHAIRVARELGKVVEVLGPGKEEAPK